jgi:putative spermidine/putrescine transport system substrate-binding protein
MSLRRAAPRRLACLALSCLGLLGLLGLLVASNGRPADAQQGKLAVASFGGAWERDLRTDLITPFERDRKIQVDYVVGLSTETLARLKAQKDNPQLDVIMLDDVLTAEAVSLGLLEKLNPAEIPNFKDLRKEARVANDYGVGFTSSATVLMYNTEKVKPAPTSWKALWDPRYKGHVAFPHINTTWGLQTLLVASQLEGGGPQNVAPGLAALSKLQHDNDAVVYTSATQLNTLAQQGQVWIAPTSSVWVNQLEKGGTPVAISVPKEGVYQIFTVWSVVKGAKNRAAALQFIDYALRRDVQERFAPRAGLMATNSMATLDPEFARRVKFDPLLQLDGEVVAKQRSAWVEAWNRALTGH